MKTTQQVARLLGFHRVTLQRWIANGKVKAPKPVKIDGGKIRFWSKKDIDRIRRQVKRRK